MSDNLRRYRAIRDALQCYPGQPTGTVARHLTTLAALISGIVARKHAPAPDCDPSARWHQAREPRQTLCQVDAERPYHRGSLFCPVCRGLARHLALQTLVLVMDGSVVGRGCVALMLHVVYKGRALPLAWQVRQGKKGHFPEDLHIALVKQVHTLIPVGASVVLLGDGEFDGTRLQHTVQDIIGPTWSGRGATSPSCGTATLPLRDRGGLYQAGDAGRAHGCARDGSRLWPGDAPLLLGQRV